MAKPFPKHILNPKPYSWDDFHPKEYTSCMTFQEIKDYIQDNPQGYWFKRKLYGWGWTPVTWQGMAVTLGYLAAIIGLTLTRDEDSSVREVTLTFVLPIIILTAVLLYICYKKGEKPRWQWGMPRKK